MEAVVCTAFFVTRISPRKPAIPPPTEIDLERMVEDVYGAA